MVPIAFEDNQFKIESCYVELRHVVFLEYLNYKLGSSVLSSFDVNSYRTTPMLKYFKEKQPVHFTCTGSTEEQYINVKETQRDNEECTQPCLY